MQNHTSAAGATVTTRPSASRKLLTVKAAAKGNMALTQGEALEDSLPRPPATEPAGPRASHETAIAPTTAADSPALPNVSNSALHAGGTCAPAAPVRVVLPVIAPAPAPKWSDAEETAFQAMLARRKAMGFQRRGRDVSGQLLCAGDIMPNPGTVAAVIVGLVAASGNIARGDLLAAMAGATFPHPKARPTDPAWCQGYVAGGIRDGYLAAAPIACGEVQQ